MLQVMAAFLVSCIPAVGLLLGARLYAEAQQAEEDHPRETTADISPCPCAPAK